MNYKLTIKLYENDIKFFGKGVEQLLDGIKEEGSLNKAAVRMEMSYSKAWRLIKTAEHSLKFKLLISKTGGKDGGGAQLTQEAEEFLIKYKTFTGRVNKSAREIYDEVF